MSELDIREVSRGTQVTFTVRDIDAIGEVKAYLGEGLYEVVDEDDNEHEIHISGMTMVDDEGPELELKDDEE